MFVVLALYYLISRYFNSRALLLLIFIVGLAFGHQSGIQTSLVAVLFGLITSRHQESTRGLQERMLNLAEPISAFVVIPVFVFITLFRRYGFSWHATTSTLVLSLIILRLKAARYFLGSLARQERDSIHSSILAARAISDWRTWNPWSRCITYFCAEGFLQRLSEPSNHGNPLHHSICRSAFSHGASAFTQGENSVSFAHG